MAHILYFTLLASASLLIGTNLDAWLFSRPVVTLLLLCGAIPFLEWRNGAYFHANRYDPVVIWDLSWRVLIASGIAFLRPTQASLQTILGTKLQTIIGWSVAVQASVAVICLTWVALIQWKNSKAEQTDGPH